LTRAQPSATVEGRHHFI